MKLILAIGTGSFIGGIFRYLLSSLIQAKVTTPFPLHTLVVNVSVLLGLLATYTAYLLVK